MAKEDKGLLEDLIGDSLEAGEQTTKTMELPQRKGRKSAPIETLPEMDEEEDPLMNELVQKRSSGGNKKLLVFGVLLFVFGLVGVAFHFGWMPLPGLISKPLKKSSPKVAKPAYVPPPPIAQASQASSEPTGAVPAPTNAQAQAPVAAAPSASLPVSAVPARQVEEVKSAAPVSTHEKEKSPAIESAQKEPAAPVKANSVAKPVAKLPAPINTAPEKLEPVLPSENISLGGGVHVQIGSYMLASSLKSPMEKLVKLGYRPIVSSSKHHVAVHEVIVGNFRSKEVAEGALKDLAEEGIKGKITKKESGFYGVLAGTFVFPKQAEKLLKRLEEYGYDAKLQKIHSEKEMQDLKLGPYASRSQAEEDLARLKAQGFEPVIVTK